MTVTTDDWLPLGAFDDERMTATIRSVIDMWAARWFTRPLSKSPAVIQSILAHRKPSSDNTWISFGNCLAFQLTDRASVSLARLAIDAPSGQSGVSPLDARLLENLGQAMINNLALDLGAALKISTDAALQLQVVSDPLAKQSGIEIEALGGGITPSIRIAIPAGSLVAFRKSLVRSARISPARLTPLIDAFDRETIAYSATLGNATMSLADVQGLEIGDVVLLETRLDDPIPVVSRKSGYPMTAARVSQAQGRIQLVLESTSGSSK